MAGSSWRRAALVWGGLAVLLVVGALVLVPGKDPHLTHTSVLNAVFDDRLVIGGTRLVGLAASVYVLLSIAVRVRRGQWLRHVGPADVETDTVQDVTADQARLQEALDRANATIASLRREYAALLEEQTGVPQHDAGEGVDHDDAG